jgi:antitoxin (DNA-binding transcriptional repressor) of toxin-antitoxin stability system
MIATATAKELNLEPSRILEQVERGDTVVIERHGLPICVMIPQPRKTSGAELALKLRQLEPAPQAASEVEAVIQSMNDAGRRGYSD